MEDLPNIYLLGRLFPAAYPVHSPFSLLPTDGDGIVSWKDLAGVLLLPVMHEPARPCGWGVPGAADAIVPGERPSEPLAGIVRKRR